MIFSYNWLQSFFEKKLPKPKELAEVLTMHSFEVESVEKKSKDWILDIDVLPDRAHDCLCHLGVAREIAAILNVKFKEPQTAKLKKVNGKIKPIQVKIQCPRLVPRYSAIVIEDIEITKSPQWLKEKLEALGIRSINNIVDLTNFIMLETGQPLHVFDYDKIRGQKMIIQQSKKGEKIITLDGVERKLEKGALVIKDEKELTDLVGIMGGKSSEIDSETKNVILQAGNFDRRTIYLTSKQLKHSTDASNIYTQGIDPNLTIPVLERTYFLLKQLGGGKIVQLIDMYPKKVGPKKIKLDVDYVEKLLGVKIPKKEITSILKRLGVQGTEVPTSRLDISIQEDLIEEIARIYGYEKIKASFPNASLIPPEKNLDIFWEDRIKDILKEVGFCEVYNYSFVEQDGEIEVANPISKKQKYLRPSLIPNLLKNVKENLKNFEKIKIFELGKIFFGKQERKMLTGLMTAENKTINVFYQVKGVVDLMLKKLGISDIWYDSYQPTLEQSKIDIWQKGECAEIKIGQEEVGFLGKISSGVVAFDIDFEKLAELASEEHEYRPISPFPTAIRDLAILTPQNVLVEQVLNKINTAGGTLVRDVDLFDMYEGRELPEGKKNLAFHIVFQAEDRTLTTKEIDKLMIKIIKVLEKEPSWEVRK